MSEIHPCPLCHVEFRKAKYLRVHTESVHSTDRSYSCPDCTNTYKRSSHLRRHIQNTHSSLDLRCEWPDCDKMFHGREQLRKHMRRHETAASHSCDLCGRLFAKKRQLESHVEKIHGPFPCLICGQTFTSRTEFRLHGKQVHHVTSCFEECEFCDSRFPSSALLRQHVRDEHQNFPCLICATTFTRQRSLRAHVLLKHSAEGDNMNSLVDRTCGHCGVVFSSVSNLRTHVRTAHEGVRRFECRVCGKIFAYKHVLIRHIQNVHNAEDTCSGSDDECYSRQEVYYNHVNNLAILFSLFF